MFKMYAPIGLLLVLASCSNNNPPSPPTGAPPEPPNVSPAQAPKTSANFNSNSPIYPKGAQYTIFCARIDGDLHVERANKLKNDLIAATGMKDWYVIHDNAQSLLYYGYYRTISDANDAAETTRAQNDRKKIDLMADKMGDRPFHGALFVALDAPDPSAPPQWNLVNALGAYSLQIAVYKDNPQRKEAAVETVREARAQGVEAYYYHGETSSLVCIGAWPESAVRINDANSAQGNDPEQPVMVLPQTKDPELDHAFEQSAEQANVRVVKPSVEILDPTLKAAMEKYPYNAMNGMYTRRMVNGIEQYDSSLLVPIPH
ncbi:MAG TPA: hypothetical protein VKK61_03590, partial [Tepidisphaeraceae bacterium]|nr:hypothetical protein [Tepidisphaeraceae bacterium]